MLNTLYSILSLLTTCYYFNFCELTTQIVDKLLGSLLAFFFRRCVYLTLLLNEKYL